MAFLDKLRTDSRATFTSYNRIDRGRVLGTQVAGGPGAARVPEWSDGAGRDALALSGGSLSKGR